MLCSNYVHAPQPPSPSSRARELRLLSPRAATTQGCVPRARALQQEKLLLIRTRESLHTATKTQCNQK